MNDQQLIPGNFYWAIPVLDVDADESWESQVQPARFVGGNEWQWIDVEGAGWPARWIGSEITQPGAAPSSPKLPMTGFVGAGGGTINGGAIGGPSSYSRKASFSIACASCGCAISVMAITGDYRQMVCSDCLAKARGEQ